jgi:signal transduction histidine kinase
MLDDRTNDTAARLVQLIALDEAERRRIAHELHSEIGQDLTAALLTLQFFAEGGLPADEIEGVVEALRGALERVRALSLRLRPPLLDEIGLEAAVRSTLEPLAAAGGFSIELTARNLPEPPPPAAGICAFRALQDMALKAPRGAHFRIELRGLQGGLQLRVEASDGASAAVEAFEQRLRGTGAQRVEDGGERWFAFESPPTATAIAPTAD